MAFILVEIPDIKSLQESLRKYPEISRKHLQRAIIAGAAELQKNATRNNVPWKTGNLVQSFGNGITVGDLYARISPTAHYAIYVHEGTKWIRKPNRFMDRIAAAAQPRINKHFETAVDRIMADIVT